MAGGSQINVSESKKVVPLNMWVLISNFKLAYSMLRRPNGTIDRHVAEFLDRTAPANALPLNGVFSFDFLVDRNTPLLCRIYHFAPNEPEFRFDLIELLKPLSTSGPVPVIVFFHGGSFVHSSASTTIYDTFCRTLVSRCRAVVVSVNYRRAPENRYPCAYEDGWSALKWVHSQSWLKSGSDLSNLKAHVYLAGDSSGGNIAHHVAHRASDEGLQVLGNILLHPMFGGRERKESEIRLDGRYFVTLQDRDWYWRAYLPKGEDRDHPACNPFGPRGKKIENLNFPKSLVVVAGLDLIQDWQLAYVVGLRSSGKEVKLLYLKKATIGYYFMPNNEHFYCLMDEIKSFVGSDC